MKPILHTSAFLLVSALAVCPIMADDTASTPNHPATAGSPGSTDSKNQENTPPGPNAQGNTGTTGTPEQTKTQDGATTDKPLTSTTRHPYEGTKPGHHKKKHHHHKTSTDTSTNAAPTTPAAPAAQ